MSAGGLFARRFTAPLMKLLAPGSVFGSLGFQLTPSQSSKKKQRLNPEMIMSRGNDYKGSSEPKQKPTAKLT